MKNVKNGLQTDYLTQTLTAVEYFRSYVKRVHKDNKFIAARWTLQNTLCSSVEDGTNTEELHR